jgi:REP-associated tyrosine transposase
MGPPYPPRVSVTRLDSGTASQCIKDRTESAKTQRHASCLQFAGMAHPYTPYCDNFAYTGRYRYFLTFVAYERNDRFRSANVVALALEQVARAAGEKQFEIIVHCFMPDHLHLVVEGRTNNSDLKAFAKLAKQYCGYYYARAHRGARLWQKGMNDHIIRDDVDLLERVRYVVNNPVAAGLVARPEDYPFLGSQRWSIAELIEWCQRRTKGSSSNDGR